MKLPIVPFDIAVKLKHMGFDWPCREHYSYGDGDETPPVDGRTYMGGFIDTNGRDRPYNNSDLGCTWKLPYGEFTAPTQALVVKWFRDEHDIYIEVFKNESWYFYIKPNKDTSFESQDYTTYEEAELEAIKYTIKYLSGIKKVDDKIEISPITNKALLITGVSRSGMWYENLVGEKVSLLREYSDEYLSREISGFINIVLKQDAKIVNKNYISEKSLSILGHSLGVNVYHCLSTDKKKDKILPKQYYRNYYQLNNDSEDKPIFDYLLLLGYLSVKYVEPNSVAYQVTPKGIQAFEENYHDRINPQPNPIRD